MADNNPSRSGSTRQITFAAQNHILTNVNVWSPGGRRIVYDVRPDAEGAFFQGNRIETVDVESGKVTTLYQSGRGAFCGVATYHPRLHRVVFILGPEEPTPEWTYGPTHRQGVTVDEDQPGIAKPLDARDLTPPFTAGALRGGSHVHVYSPDGLLISFTYDDHVTSAFAEPSPDHDVNQRNVGVTVADHPVRVGREHLRNQDGSGYSVLVSRTAGRPVKSDTDEYSRACEEGWIGVDGYFKAEHTKQKKALAFQGTVSAKLGGSTVEFTEVFVADLPEDLTKPGDGPLAGFTNRLPYPPQGILVRRLTHTSARKYPGLSGPRHWLRSSPDGSTIAFLMRDDTGISQLWKVSPTGGEPVQLTRNQTPVASAFTWSPDGTSIAHAMDGSICVTDVHSGKTRRITSREDPDHCPLPLAAVFSPDGQKVAYLRRVVHPEVRKAFNQVYVATLS